MGANRDEGGMGTLKLHLDHVVHVVSNLNDASSDFQRACLHMTMGGQHPNWGTHNALSYFDLTYIELIAIQDLSVACASDFGTNVLQSLHAGEGLVTVAFGTDDIEAEVGAMRSRGVQVAGPKAGSRRLPDGTEVAWQLALPAWPWPFLIQWEAPPQVRRAGLVARGAIREHALGQNLQLQRVAWVVWDLAAGATWLKTVYGLSTGAEYEEPQLGARCADTGAGLLLCVPTGPGPARDRLLARGEGPFLYDMVTETPQPDSLALRQLRGAWLRLTDRKREGNLHG
jgi:hypothetical protein